MAASINNRTPFLSPYPFLPHLPHNFLYPFFSCLIFHPLCDLASSISSFFYYPHFWPTLMLAFKFIVIIILPSPPMDFVPFPL